MSSLRSWQLASWPDGLRPCDAGGRCTFLRILRTKCPQSRAFDPLPLPRSSSVHGPGAALGSLPSGLNPSCLAMLPAGSEAGVWR
eukprot:14886059-Alexandrium_andersonii.AAC.1